MAGAWRLTFLGTNRVNAIDKYKNSDARFFVKQLFLAFDRVPRVPFESDALDKAMNDDMYYNFRSIGVLDKIEKQNAKRDDNNKDMP